MDEQRRFAIEGAVESLKWVIKETELRMKLAQESAESLQQTIFVAYDVSDYPSATSIVQDADGGTLTSLRTEDAREYLLRRQLRFETQTMELAQTIDRLKAELADLEKSLC